MNLKIYLLYVVFVLLIGTLYLENRLSTGQFFLFSIGASAPIVLVDQSKNNSLLRKNTNLLIATILGIVLFDILFALFYPTIYGVIIAFVVSFSIPWSIEISNFFKKREQPRINL